MSNEFDATVAVVMGNQIRQLSADIRAGMNEGIFNNFSITYKEEIAFLSRALLASADKLQAVAINNGNAKHGDFKDSGT